MEIKIPEVEARNILETYDGSNNQLLEWKRRFVEQKGFKLTRPQAEYVLKYKDVTPKVAKKYINIVGSFADKLMEDKLLPKPPEQIWVEKLLCETDKAYHIWGKITEREQLHAMWVPKDRKISCTILALAMGSGRSRSIRSLSFPASLICLFF